MAKKIIKDIEHDIKNQIGINNNEIEAKLCIIKGRYTITFASNNSNSDINISNVDIHNNIIFL